MRTIFRLIFILIFLILFKRTDSCTIFYIEKDGIVLAGNNEDWKDPAAMMFFYPAANGKHGWVKFGWSSGFPQGGMNDQGLFWDGTSGPYLEMPDSEAHKTKLNSPIMQKIIEECGNIEEAKIVIANYFHDDQYKAQYLIGDSTGNSMIVEGDNILDKEKEYQVLTNFYQSNPELGAYPCWRYNKAIELLENCNKLSPCFIGEVLADTHQEGNYPTQYSTIYDLKNGLIYLFWFHNYEEFAVINLEEELKKGYHSYEIPELFSKVKLMSPENRSTKNSTSVDFKWEGKTGNNYELKYSTSPYFITYKSAVVNIDWKPGKQITLAFLPFFLILFLRVRKKHIMFFVLLFIVLTGSRCEKEDLETSDTKIYTETVSGLNPGQTYYWKIEAASAEQPGFTTETMVYEFTAK